MTDKTTQPREQASERTDFEEWFALEFPLTLQDDADMRFERAGDHYFSLAVQDRWEAWQAGRASIAPVAAPEAPILTTGMQNQATFREACEKRGLSASQELFTLWQDARASTGAAPLVPEVAASERQTRAWEYEFLDHGPRGLTWEPKVSSVKPAEADDIRNVRPLGYMASSARCACGTHSEAACALAGACTPAATTASTPESVLSAENMGMVYASGRRIGGATTASASEWKMPEPQLLGGDEAFDDRVYGFSADQVQEAFDAGRATAPSRNAAPLYAEVEQALGHIKWLTDFAYENGCHELGYDPVATVHAALTQQSAAQASLDDNEVARLRRVVRALGMESEVPDDAETLRGCLFSVLGQIARKLESRAAQASHAGAAAPSSKRGMVRAGWFTYEGVEWVATSSDDPRATILYREPDAAMSAATEQKEKP